MTGGSSAFWQGWVAWDVTNIMALKFCRSNNYTPFYSWWVHIHCQFSVYFWPSSRRSVMVCMCPYWIWLHGFASYHMLQFLRYRKGKSNSIYHSHNCSRLVVNLTLPKYSVPILPKNIFLGQVCMLAIWSHIVPIVCNLGVKYLFHKRFFFSVQWGLCNLKVAFFLLPHCKLYHSTCFATAPIMLLILHDHFLFLWRVNFLSDFCMSLFSFSCGLFLSLIKAQHSLFLLILNPFCSFCFALSPFWVSSLFISYSSAFCTRPLLPSLLSYLSFNLPLSQFVCYRFVFSWPPYLYPSTFCCNTASLLLYFTLFVIVFYYCIVDVAMKQNRMY